MPRNTPDLVRRLLRRCLDKDPKERLRDIGDARVEIREAVTAPLTEGVAPVPTGLHAVAAVIAGLAVWNLRPAPRPGAPVRFVVSAPPSPMPVPQTDETELAISPDGSVIVYRASVNGEERLYLRHLDRLEGELVSGTAGAASGL